LLGILAVVVVLVAAGAWIGVRAYLAKGELEAAIPLAEKVQSQVTSADAEGAQKTAEALAERASSAAQLTSDPVWRLGEFVPWLGPNLTMMRELSDVVDDVSRDAVIPISGLAGGIDLASFKPQGGAMNAQPLIDAQAPLQLASTALGRARDQVDTLDGSEVIEPLASAHIRLKDAVDGAAVAADSLSRAAQLIPAMLGSAGPRNYLLVFQNNAELRSTGGIVGALALVHAENGAFQLVQQASSRDFPKFPQPVVDLPIETKAIYGDNTAQYVQDVNFTPQFPLTATITREMWSQQFGVQVDGVISIDPVALSYLLKATGPVTLANGDQLTSDNAVQLLLTDVYTKFDDFAEQDAYFADAAASVFSAVSNGDFKPKELISALAKAGEDRRVFVWSSHAEDQAVLQDTTLAGNLPVSDVRTQSFGVYLNDQTGSKMDTYLDVKFGLGEGVCRADALPNYEVHVTLTNTAPADAATSLPGYVTGGGEYGTPAGNIKTTVAVYSAAGSYNLGVLRDGTKTDYHPASDEGFTLSKITVQLAPGESADYTFGFLGGQPGAKEVNVQKTPLVYARETSKVAFSCESPLF
jgi:hypothetical protein